MLLDSLERALLFNWLLRSPVVVDPVVLKR
jgi:hypothetical protein